MAGTYDSSFPSAMQLYANAGGQGTFPDVGANTANELANAQMGARSHYAPPAVGPETEKLQGDIDIPAPYYAEGMLPAKYSIPTPMKERMMARNAIRDGNTAAGTQVLRTDPITEEEVSYLQAMKAQSELADFDRYVTTLVDPRKPGNLKWLMEVYPEYVNRRIQQVHTDYEYALRNQMIDSWGINTFDDLHFKYMVDQGKIKGPSLETITKAGNAYSTGWLSPFNRFGSTSREDENIKLPWYSATVGAKAPEQGLRDRTAPFANKTTRSLPKMAQFMYEDPNVGRPDDVFVAP